MSTPNRPSTSTTSAGLVRDILGLRGLLAEQRPLFLASVALLVGMQLCAATVSALTAWNTARIAADHLSGIPLGLALLGVAIALLGVLTWMESWWSHVLAYRVLSQLRLAMHAAVGRIAPRGLAGRRTGEVAGAAINDVEQLEWFYAHTAGASIAAVISPLIVSSTLIAMVGPPGLLAVAGLAVLLIPLWFLGPVQARQGERVRDELSALKADTLEGAQGLRDLLSLDAADAQISRLAVRTRRLQQARLRANLRAGAESAVADMVMAGVNIALFALLAARIADGRLDATILPVAVVLVFHTFTPVTGVYAMWQRLGEMAAAARRVHQMSRAESPIDESGSTPEPFDGRGDLRMRSVSAGHPGTDGDRIVLTDLDLDIPAGQTVALVGASGAGKTTLAHLLVRFADPHHGSISVGGRDLRTVASDEVRRQIVLVPQSSYAMRATLRENLLLARPDADDAAIERALAGAALEDLPTILSEGLDTPVGEGGGTLSGGQLQRLAIARALLIDPAILVLDEPVAHLDALAEAEVNAALRRSRRGRTTIVIAHRVSTIRSADRVVLLADGQIAADGNHEELLANSAEYRALLDEEAGVPPAGDPVTSP